MRVIGHLTAAPRAACRHAFGPLAWKLETLSGLRFGDLRFMGTDYDIPAPDVNTNPLVMAGLPILMKGDWKCEPSAYTGKPVEMGGSLGRISYIQRRRVVYPSRDTQGDGPLG